MRKDIRTSCLCSLAILLLAACGEDRTYEYLAKTETDNWIEDRMQEMYLYYQDMPQPEMEDYFKSPDEFFASILAPQDKFSYIEMPAETQTRNNIQTVTYGFDFVLTSDPTGTSSRRTARVLQVLPQSPAAIAGLQRGDYIVQVDGNNVTTENSYRLQSGEGVTLTVLPLVDNEEEGYMEWGIDTLMFTLTPAVSLENNPVYLAKVIEQGGQRIGYLMYNEFKSGPTESDITYMEQMLQTFQWFKQQNVTDFILDLRYNQGGQVSCAQLLAALLAPSGALGQEFAWFEFNDKQQSSNYSLLLPSEYAGYNLNLNRLFIISGLYTASASEMMVNCLRPYMAVHLIGTQTVGKNVAMTRIESPYEFVMYPVTATVYNKDGQSDYTEGFAPEYLITELNYYPWHELGDPDELLLKNTLQWIAGGIPSDAENLEQPEEEGETEEAAPAARLRHDAEPGYSSILKRGFPAAILPDRP